VRRRVGGRSLTVTVTTQPPRQIIAGDSIEFLVPAGEYASWTPSARLTGPATNGTMDHTTCVADGTNFHVYFKGQGTAPKTSGLAAGQYLLTVFATNSSDRKTIAQFPLTVLADLSTGTPTQPFCVRMLALIEAVLASRMSGNALGPIEQYGIDGTMVTRLPTADLERQRNKYSAEVQALNNPNAPIGRVKFGFSAAGQIPDLRRRF
jgi:hypothetical protein